ncbi:MAG: mechanosensitive ion channel family protein [Oscillatoriaceae cyanobacterium]
MSETGGEKSLKNILTSGSSEKIPSERVLLDGRKIFSVAITAEDRAITIQKQLVAIVKTDFDPNQIQVYYQFLNNQPVIYVSPNRESSPKQILTVTNLDSQLYGGIAPESLAQQWKEQIRAALLQAKTERSNEFLMHQAYLAAGILLGVIVCSLLLWDERSKLQAYRQQIRAQMPSPPAENLPSEEDYSGNQNLPPDTAATPETPSEQNITTLQELVAYKQRLNFNELLLGLSQLGQVILWGGSSYFILGMFPYTRWLQLVLISLLPPPLKMLGVGITSYLVYRVACAIIDRAFAALETAALERTAGSRRVTLRFESAERAIKSLSGGACVSIGTLFALAAVGIDLGPFIAGAGLIGLGISLASQSLIKDIINGFLILLEDQYAVGDVIAVNNVTGMVEYMNLRITQLRDGEGRLITIPNSTISLVQNLSKDWARVDFTIDVAYETDVDHALAIVRELAEAIYRDRSWREKMIEPPEVLGIDRLDHAGMMIRVWIKVKPLEHMNVAREFRRRIKPKFEQAGIAIGTPHRSLSFHNSLELLRLPPRGDGETG